MNENCIFCTIVKEKNNLIYEDETTVAFMDIAPISKGHILVIPKNHYKDFLAAPREIVANVNSSSRKIAEQLLKIIPTIKGFNILTNNGEIAFQRIFHYHVHIIPKYNIDKGLLLNTSKDNFIINDINDIKKQIKRKMWGEN